MEGTHAEAVREELQPMGRTRVRSLWRCVSREGNLTLEQGKSARSPPPEGQEAAETTCDELTVTPFPHPPALLRGRRERKGSEVEPGKKGGVGARSFKIWIYFLTILL